MAGFFKKLFTKFSRGSRIDWDELEADLVTADIGIRRAMNIADQFFKEQEASENLRRQIKEGLDENAKLKMELSESKREIFKLQNHKG